jgi:hypothetical protein
MQMNVLEQGEVEGSVAEKFYATLGITNLAAFKPAPPGTGSKAEPSQLWAVEYTLEGSGDVLGFPLHQKGSLPREQLDDVRDKVRSLPLWALTYM